MPYQSTKDLPASLKEKLPSGAEKAYVSAFNTAKSKGWDESRCHSYAWGAVKKNYRKSGDKWVKKAMTRQEKNMLRTAKKIRNLVAADFMEKTANPAIAAVGRALLPALRQLGPKVLQMIKNIPPEVWARIIPTLIESLTAGAPAAKAASTRRSDVSRIHKLLHEAKVAHPAEAARVLVLASVETRNAHAKKANPDVTEAVALTKRMQLELKTIKEFS